MAIWNEEKKRWVCGANKKNGPGLCQGKPMPNGKCRMHGGATPKGIASPHYKTGRYSKYLPARLQERYELSQADEELLALRSEIALLDARIEDLIKRVDTGEAGALWGRAIGALDKIKLSISLGVDLTGGLSELEKILDAGYGDYAVWNEISGSMDLRRKLVESERKRLVEMNQIITAEQATMLLTLVLDAVHRHVTDRKVLSAIQNEFIKITNVRAVERQQELLQETHE